MGNMISNTSLICAKLPVGAVITIALAHSLLNHQHCYPAHTQAHNHPEQPAAPIFSPSHNLFLSLSPQDH